MISNLGNGVEYMEDAQKTLNMGFVTSLKDTEFIILKCAVLPSVARVAF